MADQYSYAKQQAKLTASSSDDDKAAVEVLKTKRILLVGHTDDTGSTTENANLSERRAAAVARVFQGQGVPAANLYYQGAGETLPDRRQPHRGRPRRQSPRRDRRPHRRRRVPQVPRLAPPDAGSTTAPATCRCPTRRRRRRQGQEGAQGQHRLRRLRRRARRHAHQRARLRRRHRRRRRRRRQARRPRRSCPPATPTARARPTA